MFICILRLNLLIIYYIIIIIIIIELSLGLVLKVRVLASRKWRISTQNLRSFCSLLSWQD